MKQTALKELQEAIRILNYTAGDICPTTIENAKEDIRQALERINAAIFAETPSTSTKFDIYKIAAVDPMRPIMEGVNHRAGFKVASDCKVLVAVKDSYDEALEGHTLDKTGRDIIGKYPAWSSLFPSVEGQHFTIETGKVYELLKAEKAEKKAAGKSPAYRRAYVKIGEAFFPVASLAKLCTFMDAYGANDIQIYGPRHAAVVQTPDGSKALIMPQYTAKYIDDSGYLNDNELVRDVFDNKRDKCLWYEAV